jgi:hypothetical protein
MKLRYIINPMFWLGLVVYLGMNTVEGTLDEALKLADKICPPKKKPLW